jgi:hypothetical protein
MTTLPEIIGAFISDALGFIGISGGSVSQALIVGYFRRRHEMARGILFEELSQANISNTQAASEDDAIAVIVRYLRAAQEGAARLNLRLLAKAIAGKRQSMPLVADEFLQYAEALATLSRDEVLVVGAMYRHWKAHCNLIVAEREAAGPSVDPWELTLRELTGVGMTEEVVSTTASRSLRSGLLYPMFGRVGHAAARHGSLSFRVSPLLVELGTTVDFEDALRREASEQQRKE